VRSGIKYTVPSTLEGYENGRRRMVYKVLEKA
jgi:hypothetical protein